LGSFIARLLPDDYAVVVLLSKRAGFGGMRAFDVCERALVAEAGLSPRPLSPWTVVNVTCDARRRPDRVLSKGRDKSLRADVLGVIRGKQGRERAYRVRLESGAEVMLVRELGGTWYADEEVDFSGSAPSRGLSSSTR
jgi:hypothetical protein